MPNQPKTPILGVRLPTHTREALQREAEEKGKNLSELVRGILERHAKRNGRKEPK
jgi:predicted DNA-binding protein